MSMACEKRQPDGSYLTHVYSSERDWRHKTNGQSLRVIDYRLEGIEGSEPIYRLATTILDSGKAPAGELAANETIAAKKRQLQTANVRQIETELSWLGAQKARYSPEVVAPCDGDRRLQDEKTTLEGEKTTARGLLDAHTQQVITQYGQRINWYIERINASFRITTPTHNYRGGFLCTTAPLGREMTITVYARTLNAGWVGQLSWI